MALRKQFDPEALSTEAENTTDDKGLEILRKLPPGTIVIKQERKYKEDSDYVRDSTETSSGGSTSGGGVAKVRRVHRAVRKSRGTAEIRRNPIRVTKKDPDKDFPLPRQQLLSAKRKEMLFTSDVSNRGKSSTMPYMNTRSVTRKMYNVGATYHAPTVKDETEWKQWPVHGMHERPVFHPQVGLAAEYLGRCFTSLDGLSYREIIDHPEIEVVSVDPESDFLLSSSEKKQNKKLSTNRGSSSAKHAKTMKTSSFGHTHENKSFESCMHESFHSVLGFCSQVMMPSYKTNVEGKINKLSENKSSFIVAKEKKTEVAKQTLTNDAEHNSKNKSIISKENLQKSMEENKVLDGYSIAMTPQNIKNLNQTSKTRLFQAKKMYVANSQKSIAFTNLKAFQGGPMKIQEVVRSSKNPLILVNSSEAKDTQVLKAMPGNVNVLKLEDTSVSDQNLTDMSSMYKNLVSSEEPKQTPMKRGNKVEFTITKYLLDNTQQNTVQPTKELSTSEKFCNKTSNKEDKVKTLTNDSNKTWCSNDASEIAKILSEYNKSNMKTPAIENQTFYKSMKNVKVTTPSNDEENTRRNVQENSGNRNMNVKFPQGKWRRFHLTVEKLKDLKGSKESKLLPGVQNRQTFLKIDQATVDASLDRKTDVSKCLESFQRGQSSTLIIEKQNNTSTNTNAEVKTQSLQQLLENTAMLYCAATGTHQDDLANYIDTLDASQSIQWLETCKNVIV